MKLTLCNGKQIQVTETQYYTAKEWAWRTKEGADDAADEGGRHQDRS